jgi:formate hydrogenlyase subunit 4
VIGAIGVLVATSPGLVARVGAFAVPVATTPGLLARVGASVLQVVAVCIGGPLLLGLMGKIRARAEGRVGPPVTQGLLDLRKLVRKEAIRAEHTSAVAALAPLVLVASVALAAAITPLVTTRPIVAGDADAFAVVYLLLMGSVALALGGLDAGTAFGGLGSSRAMTVVAISEPALLVAVLALAIQAHTSNLPGIVAASLSHPEWLASPQRLLALAALVVVVIAEAGRIPVDNPSTHLELTMIHEAMVLEYAGPDLALVTVGEAMRLGLLLGLVANLFFPWGVDASGGGLAMLVGLVALAAKTAAIAVCIALVEISTAKLRLFRVPELLAGGFVLAAVAVTTGLVAR